eukprot:tig00000802_g4269.t1
MAFTIAPVASIRARALGYIGSLSTHELRPAPQRRQPQQTPHHAARAEHFDAQADASRRFTVSRRSSLATVLAAMTAAFAGSDAARARDLAPYFRVIGFMPVVLKQLQKELEAKDYNKARALLRVPPLSEIRGALFWTSKSLEGTEWGEKTAALYKATIADVQKFDDQMLRLERAQGEEAANAQKAAEVVASLQANLDSFIAALPAEYRDQISSGSS